jgi:hypothetical protein
MNYSIHQNCNTSKLYHYSTCQQNVPLPFFLAMVKKGHDPRNKFLKNKIIYKNVLLKKDVISVRISMQCSALKKSC